MRIELQTHHDSVGAADKTGRLMQMIQVQCAHTSPSSRCFKPVLLTFEPQTDVSKNNQSGVPSHCQFLQPCGLRRCGDILLTALMSGNITRMQGRIT